MGFERLASRDLAKVLGVNTNTVLRALGMLRDELIGMIENAPWPRAGNG